MSVFAALFGLTVSAPFAIPLINRHMVANLSVCALLGLALGLAVLVVPAVLAIIVYFGSLADKVARSHYWGFAKGGGWYQDAKNKEVYEHYHGSGSWGRKLKGQSYSVATFGFLFALVAPNLLAYWAGLRNPLSGSAQDIGVTVAVALAGASLYLAALWSTLRVRTGEKVDSAGFPKHFAYVEMPDGSWLDLLDLSWEQDGRIHTVSLLAILVLQFSAALFLSVYFFLPIAWKNVIAPGFYVALPYLLFSSLALLFYTLLSRRVLAKSQDGES